MKKKNLIIFGNTGFAEIAYHYFNSTEEYQVTAFTVNKDFNSKNILFNLPVYDYEDIEKFLNPNLHFFFAAVTYQKMNTFRSSIIDDAKSKGFKLASFISKNSFIGPEVKIGEHCFIFEGNVIQPYVKLENNIILWSGNHIGHHTQIYDNCFISSHVVISGHCQIGKNCFIGVNSTISNNLSLGEYNWIGPSCNISSNTPNDAIYRQSPAEISKITSKKFFKII